MDVCGLVFWMTVVSHVFSLFESDIIACLGKITCFCMIYFLPPLLFYCANKIKIIITIGI